MRRAALVVVSVVCASCGAPELVFVADDAGGEAGVEAAQDGPGMESAAADAAEDGRTGDASAVEASPDGTTPIDSAAPDTGSPDSGAPDTGVPDTGSTSCPGTVPSGAILCCNTVPCVAPNTGKCQSMCSVCESSCGGQTCCLHPNGSFNACAASPAACP